MPMPMPLLLPTNININIQIPPRTRVLACVPPMPMRRLRGGGRMHGPMRDQRRQSRHAHRRRARAGVVDGRRHERGCARQERRGLLVPVLPMLLPVLRLLPVLGLMLRLRLSLTLMMGRLLLMGLMLLSGKVVLRVLLVLGWRWRRVRLRVLILGVGLRMWRRVG